MASAYYAFFSALVSLFNKAAEWFVFDFYGIRVGGLVLILFIVFMAWRALASAGGDIITRPAMSSMRNIHNKINDFKGKK